MEKMPNIISPSRRRKTSCRKVGAATKEGSRKKGKGMTRMTKKDQQKKPKETKELRKQAEVFIPKSQGLNIEACISQPTNSGAEGGNDLMGALFSDDEEGSDIQDRTNESENDAK